MPENASETILTAAEELRNFIFETSGYSLSVVTDEANISYGTLSFSLGDTVKKAENANGSATKADSFVREVTNGVTYIYGGSERGVLYGVYDFIEDVLGVKFISADVTYTPKLAEIRQKEGNIVAETPAFSVRSWWTSETQGNADFAARKRLTSVFYNENVAARYGGGMYRDYYNPGHNLNALITAGGGTVSGTVCLSDAATRNAVVVGLKQKTEEYPSCKYFAVKTEDGYNPADCTCSFCAGKSASDLLVDFCNYVAAEINKIAGREIYVVTYAYGVTETPPSIGIHEKVVIELAPITNVNLGYELSSDKQCEAFQSSVSGWKQKAGNRLWFYGYGTNFGNYGWYSLNLSLIQPNIAYLKNITDGSIIIEDNHFMNFTDWQAALRAYVGSAVLWNPSAYAEKNAVFALAEEFCRYYFGESAGGAVYSYIVAAENRLEEVRNGGVPSFDYYVKDTDYTLGGNSYAADTSGNKRYLTANDYRIFQKDFSLAQISSLKTVYNAASGEIKTRLAGVLFTAELPYFANYKYYMSESEGSKYFTYDTTGSYTTSGILGMGKKTYDYSVYAELRSEISDLISSLDYGYTQGALREFYNAHLFRSMLEIAGTDKESALLAGAAQNQAFLTDAHSGTGSGFYIMLSENGAARRTSGWNVCEGADVIAEYDGKTYTCVLKGTGESNRFFVDTESAGIPDLHYGTEMRIVLRVGEISDNGNVWHVKNEISLNGVFDGEKWCVAGRL